MKRILFFLLWAIPFLQPTAHGAVEIYANGHKYDSLQAYALWKKSLVVHSPSTAGSLNKQQENYIRQKAQQMGINVDFSKIKSFQISRKSLSEATRHKIYVLSVENAMVGALRDFYQPWGQSDLMRKISSEQLQEAIQQAVTTSKSPKLLISQPGKLRIMAISPNNAK